MEKSTILIVDDHKLIRETWKMVLQSDPAIGVIAACSTAEEALEQAKSLHPNIVLLDINLPGINGLDVTALLRKYSPGSKIIGLSMHTQPTYAKQMIRNGAMGYITKNATRLELFHAINEVLAGRKYICKQIKDILVGKMMNNAPTKDIHDLTRRELEMINYIKKGFSSKEIAKFLSISSKTVEVHRYNILKKLNLKNTAVLIDFVHHQQLGND